MKQHSQAPLPDTAQQHAVSVDSWWRTQSATMALLKHAHGMVDGAEQRIAALEKRIRDLEELASSDPLTGLMNRRGFENFFEHERARIHRGHSPGAVLVLIDLDRFKSLNDTHGHQAGDACLLAVTEALLSSIRLVDGAARLGGDEFALLLTQTDGEKAKARIEKIRRKLNKITLEWEGKKLRSGASIGATEVSNKMDLSEAYRLADSALYSDKRKRQRT